ncbi:Pentulose/hexulose kinase [uncultured spirochete]|uniref:Pentulose/hexulose kinase n=1 Tax=uncultured spirochete TaxID=156406 RepID=A0A3P3XQ91_9SPIR|nr:Pentulose/hexulose kinase [uncultured spirochete]
MILGVDIGTASSKAVLIDNRLNIVSEERIQHSIEYVKPGFVEQDPEIWWADVCQLTKSLSKKEYLSKVKAVGISSMGPTVLPVSSSGEALRHSILYGIDTRAFKEIAELNDSLGSDVLLKTYSRFSSQSILPKLLWIKNNQSDIFKNTHSILAANGYIVFKLTGKSSLDYFTASSGGIIDFLTNSLYRQSFLASRIDENIIPKLYWPGEIVGNITPEASKMTGLPIGIPVIAGTTDAAAEAVISGCVEAGDSAISLGSTYIYVTCRNNANIIKNVVVSNFLSPHSYILGGATGSGGILVEWFAKNFLNSDPSRLSFSLPEKDFKKTSLIALPYLNGARTPVNDQNARGLILGLGTETKLADIYMALIESLALEIDMIVSEISQRNKANGKLRITGGGSTNEILLQAIAEVLKKDLEILPANMSSAAGAAVLAGIATKEMSMEEATKLVPIEKRVKYTGSYDEYFKKKKEIFGKAYSANKELFIDLGQMVKE